MSIVYHSPTGDMWLCFSCGKYYHTMMGDTCNKCELEERRHKELLAAIKKAAQQSVQADGAKYCPECGQGVVGFLGKCEVCGYNPPRN